MGLKLDRKKPFSLFFSVVYRVSKILPFTPRKRFTLFANLSWIFTRLAHESAVKTIQPLEFPIRIGLDEYLAQKLQPTWTILDIGCGTGELTHLLSKHCHSITGVDVDSVKCAYANKSYSSENVSFVCADALMVLSTQKQFYDVLICSHVLEHIDDPLRFLNSIKKYARYIYIEVPDFESSVLNIVRKSLSMKYNYSDDDHVYEFDRFELKKLTDDAGLDLIDSRYRYGVIQFWLSVP